MKTKFLFFAWIINLLHSCAPSANAVSNHGIQKRKYYSGWQVNLHRLGNHTNKKVNTQNDESLTTQEPPRKIIRHDEPMKLILIAQNSISESIPNIETKTIATTDSLNAAASIVHFNPTSVKKNQSKKLSIIYNHRFNPILKSKKSKDPKPILSQEMKRAKILYYVFITFIILALLSLPLLNLALSRLFSNAISSIVVGFLLPLGLLIFAFLKMKKNEFYLKVLIPKKINQKKNKLLSETAEKQQSSTNFEKQNPTINAIQESKKLSDYPELIKLNKARTVISIIILFSLFISIIGILIANQIASLFLILYIVSVIVSMVVIHKILKIYKEVPLEEQNHSYKNERSNLQILQFFKPFLIIFGFILIALSALHP